MTYVHSLPETSCERPGLYLIGVCFDGTACFRKGAKEGPLAIRRVSDDIESYSPYLHKDLEEMGPFYDLGDVGPEGEEGDSAIVAMEKRYGQKVAGFDPGESRLVTLGGEHSISLIPLKIHLAHYPDLVVIHLDAHADLRDGYGGFYFSHASVIARMLEHFGSKHELIQYGIRSGTAGEYEWMKREKTLSPSRKEFLKRIQDLPSERPLYLTFDLDYFDPGLFPGTGTPEPGGEDFHSFIQLIKVLNEKNFVGADIVELAPALDPSDVSSVTATKVAREILLALSG
ncbi:MAG: agmatinase [Bacteriovoracales bacterium]|nr:agmatinase [Bacteriovoracales bacterium]